MELFGKIIPSELILFYGGLLLLILLVISVSGLVIAIKANKKMKKVLKDADGYDIADAIANY